MTFVKKGMTSSGFHNKEYLRGSHKQEIMTNTFISLCDLNYYWNHKSYQNYFARLLLHWGENNHFPVM